MDVVSKQRLKSISKKGFTLSRPKRGPPAPTPWQRVLESSVSFVATGSDGAALAMPPSDSLTGRNVEDDMEMEASMSLDGVDEDIKSAPSSSAFSSSSASASPPTGLTIIGTDHAVDTTINARVIKSKIRDGAFGVAFNHNGRLRFERALEDMIANEQSAADVIVDDGSVSSLASTRANVAAMWSRFSAWQCENGIKEGKKQERMVTSLLPPPTSLSAWAAAGVADLVEHFVAPSGAFRKGAPFKRGFSGGEPHFEAFVRAAKRARSGSD
jgi:hypothetical protein